MPVPMQAVLPPPREGAALHIRGLHSAQRVIYSNPARFRVVNAGRRFGKTRLGVVESVTRAIMGKRCWWVGPSYPYTQVAWRGLCSAARILNRANMSIEIHESSHLLSFPSGGWAQVRSADNPDSLRSEGLDFLVLDETARIAEEAWTEALRPALSDYSGSALFISTPRGRNWYWRLYENAVNEADGWARWTFPTSANPFIAPAEIEHARRTMPERVFRQEYMAEFIEDGAGVFRRVAACATAERQLRAICDDKGKQTHEYIIGCDWGKSDDFSAFSVIDTTIRAEVELDRSNHVDYAVQRDRLMALCERFKPFVVIAELNAMGDPICEDLMRMGLPIQPFTTTSASKAQTIEALALAFERGDLSVLPDETRVAELQAYESDRLPSGSTRYSAPAGMHDDTVMALALAYSGLGPAGGGTGFSIL